MKQIAVREFQLHAKKYLGELPILLTQYGKIVAVVNTYPQTIIKSVNTESPQPQEEEKEEKWPKFYLGKPLSGRTAQCDICYEVVPNEFAQAHYKKAHGDL